MTLESAPYGLPLTLGEADLPVQRRLRLAELGLRPGATVTVVRRTAGGGRIVGIGDARVALGRQVLSSLPAAVAVRSGHGTVVASVTGPDEVSGRRR